MPESALDQYRRLALGGKPHFFEFLSRREFQLAYAVAAVARFTEYQAAFQLDAYATPGADDGMWEEQIRRAIRYLADQGLTFNGIKLDGWEIHGRRVIEPRNLGYVIRFKAGTMPNLVEALETGLEVLEGMGLEGEADTLRDALEAVRDEKQKALTEREMEVM